MIAPPFNIHSIAFGATSAITDTTVTTVIAAPSGSNNRKTFVTSLTVTNSHATVGTVVDVKTGSTLIHRGYAAPAGGGYSIAFPTPIGGDPAAAVTATCGTTGSNVYVSASGFYGAP